MAAEMWYYTTEGKQMDPVSMNELKRLVGDGTLKPTDMVWKEGMARWIRASSVQELFPDPTSSLDKYFTNSMEAEKKPALAGAPASMSVPVSATSTKAGSIPAADTPSKGAKPSSGNDGSRPPRRRTEPKGGGGGSLGIIIVLVLVGLLVLGALFGGVVIMVFFFKPGEQKQPTEEKKDGPAPAIDIEHKYDTQMDPGQKHKRTFQFRNGVSYEINVKIREPQGAGARADLFIYHHISGALEKSFPSNKDGNFFARWTPTQDGVYRIEVENKAADKEMKGSVIIKDLAQAGKGGEQLPNDVREGNGAYTDAPALQAKGGELLMKFRVQGGHPASIKVTCVPPGPNANLNIYVYKESDPNTVIHSDVRPDANASVSFTLPETEFIRVLIKNESKASSNKCIVNYDVSP